MLRNQKLELPKIPGMKKGSGTLFPPTAHLDCMADIYLELVIASRVRR